MRRYLVVANQTLCGPSLMGRLREKMEEGRCQFRLVVPATPVSGQEPASSPTADLSGAFPGGAVHQLPQPGEPAGADAVAAAEQRLRDALEELRRLGADADGHVAPADPFAAIESAMKSGGFDEIVLSTLPTGVSRWLRMDLVSRVRRRFDVPVSHVTGEAA